MSIQKQVQQIINPFSGKKDVVEKRINALRAAGLKVEFFGQKWNWGTSGTTQLIDSGTLLAQLSCAQGRGKANLCFIYIIEAA